MNKSDRTLLLTGANGGIGRALTRRFAQEGYRLVLTDLSPCDEFIDAGGLRANVVYTAPCDLSSAHQVDAFLDAMSGHADVDILVNNAAHMALANFDELTLATLHMFYRVDIEAAFQLSKFVVANMRKRGWGRIVNFVSGSPWVPSANMVGYIAAKMGLVGLTRAMAVELAEDGICVNAVTPALTRHPGIADRLPPEVWERNRNRQAIKRNGDPKDVVGAVSFLISDDAAFMTGQTMVVDGGQVFL